MRISTAAGIGSVASLLVGIAVPIAFPNADPLVGQALLVIAGLLFALMVGLWWPRKGANGGGSISQVTSAPQSSNYGMVEGGVHNYFGPPEPAERQERTKPATEQAEEYLSRIARAAEGYPAGLATFRAGPARPDLTLKEVAKRVVAKLGDYPEGGRERTEYIRRLNLEIADRIHFDNLTVWARYADFPLEKLDKGKLRHVIVDVANDMFSIPNQWDVLAYTDVQFVKAEIDHVWPEQPEVATKPAKPGDLADPQIALKRAAKATAKRVRDRLKYVDRVQRSGDQDELATWQGKAGGERVFRERLAEIDANSLPEAEADRLEYALHLIDDLNDRAERIGRGEGYRDLAHAAGTYHGRAMKLFVKLSEIAGIDSDWRALDEG